MVAATVAPHAARAQTTWTGTTSANWSTGSNWTNGVADASTATTLSGAGGGNQPTLTTTSSAGSVNMTAGTLNLGAQTLNVTNAFTMSAGVVNTGGTNAGVLNVGSLTQSGGTISSGVTVTATGAVALTGGSYANSTTLQAGTLATSVGVTFGTSGTLTTTGGFTNAGTANVSGGSVNGAVTNSGLFSVSGTVGGTTSTFANTGTLTITPTGNYSGVGAITNSSTVGVNAGGTLSAVSLTQSAGTTSIAGTMSLSGALANNAGIVGVTNGTLNAGTIVNAATVTVSGTGTVATTGGFTNNGTVSASGGAVNGAITNTSMFNITGLVTGNSTFANSGTLFVGAGRSFTGLTAISNFNTMTVNTGGTLGGGSYTQSGGTTNNQGTFSFTGAVTVNGGTFMSTSAVTATGGLINNAQVIVQGGSINAAVTNNAGATFTVAQSATGNSSFSNAGALNIAATRTYSGLTAISNSNVVTINAAATLSAASFTQSAGTTVNNGTLSLTGALAINGGTLNTGGTLTATGGFTNSGTVNASGGTINANVTNNNGGVVNVMSALTVNGAFTNNGGVAIGPPGGSLTVTGLLTNTAVINVGAGRSLNASGSGISNLGAAIITNNGTITDDLNNSGTVTNNATFNGNVASNTGTITNTGTWTGNIANSAGGTFNANGGSIVGSVSNSGTFNYNANTGGITSFTNNAGGMLNYSGTRALGVSLVNNGTFGGATTSSVMNITGNYTQGSGGTYSVMVNAAGQNSSLNVTGTAALAGMVGVQASQSNYAASTSYTILHATGGLGGTTFGGVTSNYAFLTPSLSYTSTDVMLTLVRSSFQNGVSTPNLKSVATALDQSGTSGTSDFNNVIGSLLVLDTTQGPKALDMLSGQGYAGFANVMTQSVLVLLGNYSNQTGGGGGSSNRVALAEACDVACDTSMGPRWGAWGGGMGSFGTVIGDPSANAHGVTYNLGGFLGGLDYRFNNNFLAGVMAGFTASSLYTQDIPGQGWSNAVQLGLYGRYTEGDAYLDGVAGYARADNRMTRTIIFPGVYRVAYGQTSADQFFGQLEAGYKFGLSVPSSYLTPFARLQASTVTQAGFSETGADSLNLNVAAATTNSLRTVLGGLLGGKIEAVDLVFRLGWSHEYANTSLPVTATFAGAPSFAFTTFGATAPRDGAVIGLAATTMVGEATSLYFRYDGELQGGNTNNTLTAGVRYVW